MEVKLSAQFLAQGGELCEVLSLPLPPKASRAASMGCAQHLSRCWCQSADRKIEQCLQLIQ